MAGAASLAHTALPSMLPEQAAKVTCCRQLGFRIAGTEWQESNSDVLFYLTVVHFLWIHWDFIT